MTKRIFLAFSVFVLAQTAVASNPFLPKERTTALDGEWRFAKDGGPFMTVEVPHDWGIAGPFKKDGDGNTGKLPWKGTGVKNQGTHPSKRWNKLYTTFTSRQRFILCAHMQ